MEDRASWLLPAGVDRARMLDMDRQLQPVRRASFAVLAVALLLSGPWLGFWTIIPLALAGVLFGLADRWTPRASRPEYALFAAWTGSQAIIAVSVALVGGAAEPTMAWLAIPLLTLGARFSERGIAVGVGISFALLLIVAFAVDAAAVLAEPPLVIAPAALMASVAMFQAVLMRSDVKHRAEAVVDPLTGLLNRKALVARGEELAQQSGLTGAPVGVVMGDIDHFKRVNDEHGHAAGDAVLTDVAAHLRRALRAFDLVYRIGGEEFLVLLPGADAARVAEIAEELRVHIATRRVGDGLTVTMSFGVASLSPFDLDAAFADADAALYAAKRGGRDRVAGVGVLRAA